jgi:hypothetical protein
LGITISPTSPLYTRRRKVGVEKIVGVVLLCVFLYVLAAADEEAPLFSSLSLSARLSFKILRSTVLKCGREAAAVPIRRGLKFSVVYAKVGRDRTA